MAKCEVWGVVSDAETWAFLHIDNNGQLSRSDNIYLGFSSLDNDQIVQVYRALYYIIRAGYDTDGQ